MENNQIAIIICANDEQYYDECIRYIEELRIPEGYNVDILCIQEAESMAKGYNAGMQESDAKYKIYLHQDTFILNRNFIYDVIEIFQKDKSIGMLGVLGTNKLCVDRSAWLQWEVGCIEQYDGRTTKLEKYFQTPEKAYIEVCAIDGFIMVTQYDVPWREDFLDGWDFYDIAQSLEMQRKGYKVVVPYQESPWCYHDCGVRELKESAKCMAKLGEEYPDIFKEKAGEIKEYEEKQSILELESIRYNLIQLLEKGEYQNVCEFIDEIRSLDLFDTQIREIANIMEIYSLEESCIDEKHSEFFRGYTWEQMYEYYRWIHFVLLRIEYGRMDERIEELRINVEDEKISKDAIWKIANSSLNSTSRVYECLLKDEYEMPLVSVVVPVYNGADIIGGTLESILNQTYSNMEIIVVDDASTDNSREIISSYKDSRIRPVFLEKNHNVCYSGNIGFQLAKGKYVALIGHDDLWKEDKLEKQVSFLEKHPTCTVCFTWVDIIDEDKNIINDQWQWLYDIFCGNNYSQDYWKKVLLLGGNQFCAPSACIRRAFLGKTGFYRYGLVQLQDYDLWMRLLCEGPVYVLQEKLVLYRRFAKEGRNLSSINRESQNRGRHEQQWIQDSFINKLASEEFVRIFKNDLKNPKACGEKEILCEKVLFLRRMRNCFFSKRFIELIEDEECRDILEEKYHLKLTDFYKMNAEPLLFDDALIE